MLSPLPRGRQRPWLRLVLAVSLDGRLAPPEGGAAQIGGRGDRRVLEEALAWADAVLIGAETLRRHGTTCLLRDPDLLQRREQQGRSAQPIAIAVSRQGSIPEELPFFRQPLERWLLLAEAQRPAAPRAFDRVLPLGSWPEAMACLADDGIARLAVLGGAALAASLVAADLLDELQITLCPRLLGGAHHWLPAASARPDGRAWTLVEQRPLGEGELLLRYRSGSFDAGPAGSSSSGAISW